MADKIEAGICARMMSTTEPWITLQRDFDSALEIMFDPEREVYVALQDDEIAGFAILAMQGPFRGYLQSLAVAPSRRNRGIGHKLLTYIEERVFGETPNVFVCASSFNPGARRLYEKCGYELIGELKGWIVPGHSEFLLRKSIGSITGFTPGDKQ
ncbi:MAG: GNAT family N-acetyltransferase [bacterium]|nr:GNAT family N-acetyltransferase [bacterium]